MAFIDDFTAYPFSKVIRQTNSASDSVYSVNVFFSFWMQLFDEPGYHGFPPPMRFNTPTSYTMLNGWFLDDGDGSEILKRLFGGDIGTLGYSGDVLVLDYDTVTTDFVAGDLDSEVLDDATPVGPLLSFKTNYPSGGGRIWVRDTETHGAIGDGSSITISATAEVDADGASFTGEEAYANPFALATFIGTPDPQPYIYWLEPKSQNYERVPEWSAYDNFDRGAFDVLIPVRIGGVLNNSGLVDIFSRQTADTFTHVEDADLSAGTRTPISLETSADEVNITTGEWYLMFDASTGAGAFAEGDVIQNVSTGSTTNPSWYAEVVAVTEFAVNTTGVLEIRTLRGTPADNDSIWVGAVDSADVVGTVGDTYVQGDGTGTEPVSGDLNKPLEGGTSTGNRVLRAFDNAENVMLLQVLHSHDSAFDSQDYTGSGRDVLFIPLVAAETLSAPTSGTSLTSTTISGTAPITLTSGFSDITIAHINGTITTGSFTGGPFTPGERVTWNAGGSEAIVVNQVADTSLTLANVDPTDEPVNTDVIVGDLSGASATASAGLTDANTSTFAFPLQSAFTYAVYLEGGSIYNAGRTFLDINAYCQFMSSDGANAGVLGSAVDPRHSMHVSDGSTISPRPGETYITADAAYTVSKAWPFGQKAGDLFFAAQSIFIEGMASSNGNFRRLTDHSGNPQQPDVSFDLSINDTRVHDRVTVSERDGSTLLPLKTQYTSHNTNNSQGDATFERDAVNFPNDTPASGSFTVIDNANNEEHRYRFSSWATTVLTLAAGDSGTATASSGDVNANGYYELHDSGAPFSNVQIGDIIRRTNNEGGWAYVVSVESASLITTTKLSAGPAWDSSATADTFETNLLVETYDNSDTFYVSYVDIIEDTGTDGSPGSITQNLTFVSGRNVIGTIRNVDPSAVQPIVPLTMTGTLSTAGTTLIPSRADDTVGTY